MPPTMTLWKLYQFHKYTEISALTISKGNVAEETEECKQQVGPLNYMATSLHHNHQEEMAS
jgi:hypothetical protein